MESEGAGGVAEVVVVVWWWGLGWVESVLNVDAPNPIT